MRNQKGFITIDFLFAFVLVISFSALLFALTMTLSIVEVTQYVTFAAARNYVASHINAQQQESRARLKYQQLIQSPVLAPLYKGNWFTITKDPEVGDITSLKFPQYKQTGPEDPNLFWGVGTLFTAKILDFQVPFFGSTNPEGDGSGSGFQTYIASYLGRDPTSAECYNFNVERWKAIRNLPVSGAAPYSANTQDQGYFLVTDNGC